MENRHEIRGLLAYVFLRLFNYVSTLTIGARSREGRISRPTRQHSAYDPIPHADGQKPDG
jgi:hypothetical protein